MLFRTIGLIFCSLILNTLPNDGDKNPVASNQMADVSLANCNFTVDAGQDIILCPNESGQLQGSISGNFNSFRWEPSTGLSDPNSLTPTVSTNIARTYTLIAEGTSDNLITNGGFEDGSIAPSTTGYAYVDPNSFVFAGDGSYTIGNSATLGNIWGCSPHSGNWAMAINGATSGGIDVWCQTVNVTPGADHSFEAWVMGITIPFQVSYANLEFSINGDVLGTLEAPPNTCTWAPFMAMWNSGGNNTATVCIRNLNTSSTGNYCAIDDIALFEKCERTDEVEVTVDQLIATIQSPPLITCDRNPVPLDGTGSSSGPGYTYFWDTSDGEIVGPRTNITAQASMPGTYTLTVTSPAGCTETVEIFVDGNVSPPDISATGDTLGCDKPNGQISALSLTPDVSYSWKGPDGFTSSEREPTVSDTGDYTIIVTDVYGCEDSLTVKVVASGFLPELSIEGDSIRCTIDSVTISAKTNAGLPEFSWTGPENFMADSSDIIVRDTGWYIVQLTDSSGCQRKDSFFVKSLIEEIIPELSGDTITCDRPRVDLVVENDSAGVTFEWTGPNNFSASDPTTPVSEPGWYQLRIIDEDGCEGIDSIFIESDTAAPEVTFRNDTLDCLDTAGQFIILNAEDNYEYSWTGPNNFSSMETEPLVKDTGEYQVIITSENGCTDTLIQRLSASLDIPQISVSRDTLNCLDITGQLSALTNEKNLTFSWTGPNGFSSSDSTIMVSDTGKYDLEVVATNGCINRITTLLTGDFSPPGITGMPQADTIDCNNTTVQINLETDNRNYTYDWTGPDGFTSSEKEPFTDKAGDYSVFIRGDNGCDTTLNISIIEDFTPPDIDVTGDTITCADPVAMISGNSRTSGVSYEWTGPNGFTGNEKVAMVTDSGTYTLTVIAPNGCRATSSIYVSKEADFPEIEPIADELLTCEKTSVELTPIVTGAITAIEWLREGQRIAGGPSLIIDEPGQYSVEITNMSGCTGIEEFEVEIDTLRPDPDFSSSLITCFDTVAVITDQNQQSIWEYSWVGPAGFMSSQADPEVNNGGVYQVTVTNTTNGCTATRTVPVEEKTAAPDSVSTLLTNPTCESSDGSILFNEVTGGEAPYEYSIDGGSNFINNPLFDGLSGGSYELVVRDVNGCEKSLLVDLVAAIPPTISVPPVLTLTVGATAVIEAQPSIPPSEIASISWSPQDGLSCGDCLDPVVTGSVPRSYTITITDLFGCSASAAIRIEINSATAEVFVPNAFTPNEDGNNDIFRPSVSQAPDRMNMQIFDRWGNRVFSLDSPWNSNSGWNGKGSNGKELNPGVFVYHIVLYYGTEKQVLTGDVTLIR